jgi:outer membrane lipoprotein SlyB
MAKNPNDKEPKLIGAGVGGAIGGVISAAIGGPLGAALGAGTSGWIGHEVEKDLRKKAN